MKSNKIYNIPDDDWNNYMWHMTNRITRIDELEEYIKLSDDEIAFFKDPKHFPFAITPYVLSIIDKENPNCPIRKQFIPTIHELNHNNQDIEDSLNEHEQMPVNGIVHRYNNRCLFLTTLKCSSYCRFCTRSFFVNDNHCSTYDTDYREQLQYIRDHEEIVDVILSGGDFLLLPDDKIEYLLSEIKKIKHVRILRIGTRVPIVLPQRITPELVNMIKKYNPLFINIHINHHKEFTIDSKRAITLLCDAGFVCSSQTVLLAGINDCPEVMKELMYQCLENRVRPYYLFQCDLVKNAVQFVTPINTGIEIIEHLRGHISGLANVTYIVDAPGGLGKIPVIPNYLISSGNESTIFRSYKGKIFNYPNIQNKTHDKKKCEYCNGYNTKHESVSDLFCDIVKQLE